MGASNLSAANYLSIKRLFQQDGLLSLERVGGEECKGGLKIIGLWGHYGNSMGFV